MKRNYFFIDPLGTHYREQGCRGKVIKPVEDGIHASLNVCLINPFSLFPGRRIECADQFIELVEDVCAIGSKKVYPPHNSLHESSFENNYVKGIRVAYETDFLKKPTFNEYTVTFFAHQDRFLFENTQSLPTVRRSEINPIHVSSDSFDNLDLEEGNGKREYEELSKLAEEMMICPAFVNAFAKNVTQKKDRTLGNFISYAGCMLLRKKVPFMAHKNDIPLICYEDHSNENYSLCKKRNSFVPFTDILRKPATLLNQLNVLYFRKVNGWENKNPILFDDQETLKVVDYINQKMSEDRESRNKNISRYTPL